MLLMILVIRIIGFLLRFFNIIFDIPSGPGVLLDFLFFIIVFISLGVVNLIFEIILLEVGNIELIVLWT